MARLNKNAVDAAIVAGCNEARAYQSSEPNDAIFEAAITAYLSALPQPQAGEPVAWEDRDDDLSPAILASHPVKSKSYKTYERAMELVGNRHSKGALVCLVNHLLIQAEKPHPADERVVEALRAAYDKVKLWPETRMPGVDVSALGEGFTDLLALRNLIPATLAALSAKEGRKNG